MTNDFLKRTTHFRCLSRAIASFIVLSILPCDSVKTVSQTVIAFDNSIDLSSTGTAQQRTRVNSSGLVAKKNQQTSHPNVILILADDLAWSDLACYGHPWHQTPELDQLAKTGKRFTQAYASAPICSASRASLLTGKSTARLGFEFVTKNEPGHQKIDQATRMKAPPYKLNLDLDHLTLPELLGPIGYQSVFAGKWHLNAHHRQYLGWSPTHGPFQQGFSSCIEDFGSHPYAWKKNPPISITQDGVFPKDSLIERFCRQLKSNIGKAPSFHMASFFHVHTPVKTSCEWLLKKYEKLIPRDTPNREKRVRYAAFVEILDHRVGQILQALKESDKLETTLIMFTSDNGGHPEYTANAPLRGSKWNLYEGGIRVPLIVNWPGTVKANTISNLPVIGYDIAPTLMEICGNQKGFKQSGNVDGTSFANAILEKETNSPALHNTDPLTPDPLNQRSLIWHFPYYHPETGYAKAVEGIGVNDFAVSKTHPQSAIRIGDYKLIWLPESKTTELYNLKQDISESTNLAKAKPELNQVLRSRLINYLRRVDARLAIDISHEND